MKLASWNVNGIRACASKNFWNWMTETPKQLICLQEIKAQNEQLQEIFKHISNYSTYFACANKKGYSGVAILAHHSLGHPLDIKLGIGIEEFDQEGRTIVLEYSQFILVCTYYPNGQRDHKRVDFKLQYGRALLDFLNNYRKQGKEIIICGDFNTAHREIDLKNPKGNKETTGFLPHERAYVDEMIEQGYIDVFRTHYPQLEGQYTWWSYRPGCRQRNIGWRIDYFFVTQGLCSKVKQASIHPHILGSDHCPIEIELGEV